MSVRKVIMKNQIMNLARETGLVPSVNRAVVWWMCPHARPELRTEIVDALPPGIPSEMKERVADLAIQIAFYSLLSA